MSSFILKTNVHLHEIVEKVLNQSKEETHEQLIHLQKVLSAIKKHQEVISCAYLHNAETVEYARKVISKISSTDDFTKLHFDELNQLILV